MLALTGCAALPLPAPPRPIPPEAHRLITSLEQRWARFADLRALAEITIKKEGRSQHWIGALLLRAPASVRFEALTPWGQPFLFLVSTEDRFTLYDVAENRALVGPPSAEATERWLGFALGPEELVGILSGHILPPKNPQSAEMVDADALGPSLRLAGSEGEQRIWLDSKTLVPLQVESTGGRATARISYAGNGTAEPPSSVTLTALDRSLTITIRYREASLGVGLSADLFHLSLPQHTKIQRLR